MARNRKPEPFPTRLYARWYSGDGMLNVEQDPKEIAVTDEVVEAGVYVLVGTVKVANRTEVSSILDTRGGEK